MRQAAQLFVLTEAETWQFRRSRAVSGQVMEAVCRVCIANTAVRSCFLLDARQTEGADVKLVIALSLDDEAVHFRQVATQLQDALSGFPDVASKTAIMSAASFEKQFAGAEAYVR